jgi:hypothetical protein
MVSELVKKYHKQVIISEIVENVIVKKTPVFVMGFLKKGQLGCS